MNIADYLVQRGEKQDDCLVKKCFPVNIRLMQENAYYRALIVDIIHYMCNVAVKEFDDYGKLKGLSGANVGIPFNIVVLVDGEKIEILVNPKIIENSDETRVVKSNCGSLQLKKSIKVKRYKEVTVQYYNIDPGHVPSAKWFIKITQTFTKAEASTLQHEIDHNNGILINNHKRTAD